MCQKIDTILLIKICPTYSHLRENKDLQNDFHLVEYFNQVLKIRQSLEEWISLSLTDPAKGHTWQASFMTEDDTNVWRLGKKKTVAQFWLISELLFILWFDFRFQSELLSTIIQIQIQSALICGKCVCSLKKMVIDKENKEDDNENYDQWIRKNIQDC